MRQIDNYTDKQREVLDLKGMTAPRTASERTEHGEREFNVMSKTGAVMYVYAKGTEDAIEIARSAGLDVAKCSEVESEKPQGNKAQHSPTPTPWNEARPAFESEYETWQAERDQWRSEASKFQAHADKLAEALRDCITTPGALAEKSHEYALRRLKTITEAATYALAAYESEVQP